MIKNSEASLSLHKPEMNGALYSHSEASSRYREQEPSRHLTPVRQGWCVTTSGGVLHWDKPVCCQCRSAHVSC